MKKLIINGYFQEETSNSVEELLFNNNTIKRGIYFLYKDDKIIYIGKSTNLGKRLYNHKVQNLKDFDIIKVYTFKSNADIHYLEPYLINYYKPLYNKEFVEPTHNTLCIKWKKAIKDSYLIKFNY